uniref:F-box domain-containing protein n=1 Tax=Oryza glaberrima TaxID=4538 RepID=I1QYH7_ORYGL
MASGEDRISALPEDLLHQVLSLLPSRDAIFDEHLVSQNLTFLELQGVRASNRVLDFTSCPALLDLKMHGCQMDALEMCSPSVKHLSIMFCSFFTNHRFWISFPSLVSFFFDKNSGRAPRLDGMPSLATATVRLGYGCDDQCLNGFYNDCEDDECMACRDYDGHDECVFLKGLTEATELKLLAFPKVVCL